MKLGVSLVIGRLVRFRFLCSVVSRVFLLMGVLVVMGVMVVIGVGVVGGGGGGRLGVVVFGV